MFSFKLLALLVTTSVVFANPLMKRQVIVTLQVGSLLILRLVETKFVFHLACFAALTSRDSPLSTCLGALLRVHRPRMFIFNIL